MVSRAFIKMQKNLFKKKKSKCKKTLKRSTKGHKKQFHRKFIDTFCEKDLVNLEMKNINISHCLTLSRQEVVLMHLKNTRNFVKIENLFNDIPFNSFSDKKKEFNNWTLRELLLLVDQLHTSVSALKGMEILKWEKIDSPRDGGEETWKKIVDSLPKTFEQALKRVKTHVVSRVTRPTMMKDSGKEIIWDKYGFVCITVRKEFEQKGLPVTLHPKNILEAMSPLGRLFMYVKGMNENAKHYAERYNQHIRNEEPLLKSNAAENTFKGLEV